ncbi:hypothetical protein BBK14_18470 [Parafrankia soli]|uniref:Uncharacterized protein n=1 Tax=Parafrankia soli TaxID=2599596 RepID=A0A1S1Q380_9ACTN|nr:hypothetical protein BBK14_18470 [Parafrankia soli]
MAVRRQLADHGWCDLIVGIIQVIEAADGVVDSVQERARDIITRAVMSSSMQGHRDQVTGRIMALVVDRVWSALFEALKNAVPPLSLLTNEDLLRALRILAVFICPAPGLHSEVLTHALRPLGEDARGYLTDQTKEYLGEVFVEWRVGDSHQGRSPGDRTS